MPKTENLSTSPGQIRRRLKRKRDKGGAEVELYLQHVVKKPLEEWDLEELARGKARNQAGGFTNGPRNRVLDPHIQTEIQRRLRDRSLITLRSHVAAAVEVLAKLLKSEDEKMQYQAAKLIIEYTIGVPQQNVTVEGQVTIATMLAGALVLDDGRDAHPVLRPGEVLEGELVDEDDEGGDDDGDDL